MDIHYYIPLFIWTTGLETSLILLYISMLYTFSIVTYNLLWHYLYGD